MLFFLGNKTSYHENTILHLNKTSLTPAYFVRKRFWQNTLIITACWKTKKTSIVLQAYCKLICHANCLQSIIPDESSTLDKIEVNTTWLSGKYGLPRTVPSIKMWTGKDVTKPRKLRLIGHNKKFESLPIAHSGQWHRLNLNHLPETGPIPTAAHLGPVIKAGPLR